MQRLRDLLRFMVPEFGPLIAFLLLDWWFGIKIAIAGTVTVAVLDTIRRLVWRVPFTRIGMLATSLAVAFGIIDLLAANPFMLKYEAVITNLATGVAFAVGAGGTMPLLQEFAERGRNAPFPVRPDVKRFFQLFTLLWAAYFFLKAVLYLWVGAVLPLDQAIVLRSVIGGVSLLALIAISMTQGRRLFDLCRWIGVLPNVEADFKPGQTPERKDSA